MTERNLPARREPADITVRAPTAPARPARKEGPGTPLGPSPFPVIQSRVVSPAPLPAGAMRRMEFAEALRFLSKAIERRASLPILKHVRFRKGEITATDLDLALRAKVENAPALEVAVPADLLERVVRGGKDPLVRIEPTGNSATPSVLVDGAMLVCVDAKEFPSVDGAFEEKDAALAELLDLHPRIPALLPAVSTDETRFSMSGVYVEPADGFATATDGHRLHRLTLPAAAMKTKRAFLVPPRALSLALQIRRTTKEPVRVAFHDKVALFRCGPYELSARLIDGEFPDYRTVIPDPKKMPGRITVDREALIGAIGAVRFCTTEASKGIRLALGKGKLLIEAKDPDKGEARREVSCEGNFPPPTGIEDPGKPPPLHDRQAHGVWSLAKQRFDKAKAREALRTKGLGINPRYLLEALSAVEGERVTIHLEDEYSPIRLEDEELQCVVMPMRL